MLLLASEYRVEKMDLGGGWFPIFTLKTSYPLGVNNYLKMFGFLGWNCHLSHFFVFDGSVRNQPILYQISTLINVTPGDNIIGLVPAGKNHLYIFGWGSQWLQCAFPLPKGHMERLERLPQNLDIR